MLKPPEYARMLSEKKVRPTKKLLALVDVYGSVNAAAKAWDIDYTSLRRFLGGDGGITLDTATVIVSATGLRFEDLFTQDGK